jgi:hypothetical protein
MQGIEIPIGAPLGQLDKDLKDANGKLKSFAAEASKSAGVLGGSVVRGSNQAAFALTNLGRVAQDAPFGFIGIQNNLNPLLESFQRLKAETGTTGGALKALGQSLIGPAGLGIALSVVSAGILFYQQYQQRANRETEKAKKTTEDYAASLEAVSRIQLVGAQNSVKEITELKNLYSTYQNANLPLSQRKDAYSELQKQYPSYFGNLKFEEKASEKVKTAYDKLSQSIIATGRARAGIDLITKNEQKKLENEQKIVDLQTEENVLSVKRAGLLKTSAELQRTSTREGAGISQLVQANSVQGDINENLKIQDEKQKEIKKINEDNLRITQSINAEILKGAKITGDVGGKGPKSPPVKDIKTVADVLAQLDIDLKKVSNAVDITFGQGNKDKVKAFATALDSLTEIGAGGGIIKNIQNQLLNTKDVEASARTLGVTTVTAFTGGFASAAASIQGVTFKPQYDLLNQELVAFNESLSKIVSGGLTDTFAGIGNAIGTAMANGTSVAGALGQTLLSSLGSVLGQLGQMAIATGVAILGIKLSLKSLNPVAAIAGGVALLALSGYVRGRANKISGGMGGGSGGGVGNMSAPVPQTSAAISTSAAGSAQDFGGGRVVFEISGTNLIGVLNRAGAKLTRFG